MFRQVRQAILLYLTMRLTAPRLCAVSYTHLAASILDLGFKKSVIAVMCGVVIAGIIMGIGSVLVANGINFIFAP